MPTQAGTASEPNGQASILPYSSIPRGVIHRGSETESGLYSIVSE